MSFTKRQIMRMRLQARQMMEEAQREAQQQAPANTTRRQNTTRQNTTRQTTPTPPSPKPKPKPKLKLKRKVKVDKPKPPPPPLNRDPNPLLDMEGNYLPDMYRSNYLGVPAYDITTGRYINQGINKNSVNCWTRYNKSGNPYTTCYNNDYSVQLRKGQAPKGGRYRKPTKSQLKRKKKELKPTNREPDLNYTLL